jgi:hypothetical protein
LKLVGFANDNGGKALVMPTIWNFIKFWWMLAMSQDVGPLSVTQKFLLSRESHCQPLLKATYGGHVANCAAAHAGQNPQNVGAILS